MNEWALLIPIKLYLQKQSAGPGALLGLLLI
jgi:hypothetical protein